MNPTTLLSGLGAAITADPSLGGASSAGRGASPGTGDLFLALVTGLLQGGGQATTALAADPDGSTGQPATDEGASEAVATGAVAPTVAQTADLAAPPAEAGDEPTDESTDGTESTTAAGTLAMMALAVPVLPAITTAATDVTAEPAPSTVDALGQAGPDVATAPVADGSDQTGSGQAGSDQSGADHSGTGQPGSTASGADRSTDPSPTPAVGDTAGVIPTAAPRAEVTAAAPTQVTALTTAAPLTPTTTVAASGSSDAPRVADQVFPEVLRATTNATSGTSRVTVKLHPESLGEVRVVLTQRRGELEVSLAGGTDARRALTEGAPELRRLLESVGRADSRILIRDLPAAAPAPSTAVPSTGPSTRTDVSTDLAGGAWSGAGRPGGESASNRENPRHHPGSTNATDGIPRATDQSRSMTTARQGHAGLDLSM